MKFRIRNVQTWFSPLAVVLVLCLSLAAFARHTTTHTPSHAKHNQDSDIVGSGEVRPIRYVKLTSDVRGVLKELYVKEGDLVEDGQPLVLIEKQARAPKSVTQYSPLRGVVADIPTRVGEIISLRMKPLMTIADMAQINIEIALDESEIGLVRPGQSARIIVDAFHETEVSGVVQRIRPLPVRPPAPKEFIVVIEMKEISSNIRDRLRPGMSATAWIKVRS